MISDEYIKKRKGILKNSFNKNMSFLKEFIKLDDYKRLEDIFLNSSLATMHSFYHKNNMYNYTGRHICFFPITTAKINNSKKQCKYKIISQNPETDLIETGEFEIISENGVWDLDIEVINNKINKAIKKSTPCKPSELSDFFPFSRSFKNIKSFDLVKNSMFPVISELEDDYKYNKVHTEKMHLKINGLKKYLEKIDKNENEEYKEIEKQLKDARKNLFKKPSIKISQFLNRKRGPGIDKQKKKSLLMFYKSVIENADKKQLVRCLLFNPYEYNLIKGYHPEKDNSKNVLKERSLYRKQALYRYPLMGRHLVRCNFIDEDTPPYQELDMIDEGISPEKCFNYLFFNEYSLKEFKKSFKKLEYLNWQRIGTGFFHDIKEVEKIIPALKALPNELIPQKRIEWVALKHLADTFNKKDLPKVLENSFGRNKGYKNFGEFTKSFGNNSEIMKDTFSQLKDFLDDFENRVILPHICLFEEENNVDNLYRTHKAKPKSVIKYLDTFSIKKLFKFSFDWHTPERRVQLNKILELGDLNIEDSWESITESKFISNNNLKVICLNNGKHLIDEGNRMNHCVGSYVKRCLFNNSNIISIRDENNTSLSTAELMFSPQEGSNTYKKGDDFKLTLIQHRGKSNETPSKECIDTLKEFMEALKKNKININPDVINKKTVSMERCKNRRKYLSIGFNPNNKNGVGDMTLNFFSRYMNKEFKGQNYEDFSQEIKNVIQSDFSGKDETTNNFKSPHFNNI